MKIKRLLCAAAASAVALCSAMSVSAAGINDAEAQILATLRSIDMNGVKVPESYITAAENYFLLDGVDVTAEQASACSANLTEAAAYVAETGATAITEIDVDGSSSNYNYDIKPILDRIPADAKAGVISYCHAVADDLGLTFEWDSANKSAMLYDTQGQVVASMDNVIKATGGDASTVAVAGGALAAVLAGVFVISKKNGLFDER